MKINVKVKNIVLLVNAFNNAYIAYHNTIGAIVLGCDIPKKLEPLRDVSEKTLMKRLECLKNIYEQLIEKEKEKENAIEEIELEIEDITSFAIALNNACISFSDIVFRTFWGMDLPTKLEKLSTIPEEELQDRFICLKDMYEQITKIEKEKMLLK